MWRSRSPYILMMGSSWCSCYEKQLTSFQNVKHRVNTGPSNSTSRFIYFRDLKTCVIQNLYTKKSCIQQHYSWSPKSQNNPNTHQLMSRYIKCGLPMHWNVIWRQEETKILTPWMNPKNIMLRGKSQSQKTADCISPFIWKIWERPGTGGRGDWGVTANGF